MINLLLFMIKRNFKSHLKSPIWDSGISGVGEFQLNIKEKYK